MFDDLGSSGGSVVNVEETNQTVSSPKIRRSRDTSPNGMENIFDNVVIHQTELLRSESFFY